MNTFTHKLKRALKLPPQALARKLLTKSRHASAKLWQMARDHRKATFSTDYKSHTALNVFSHPISLAVLNQHADWLSRVTTHYINHRFQFLGLNWQANYYGVKCPGIENICYNMTNHIKAPPDSNWLVQIINRANIACAKPIMQQLPSAYKPIDWQLDMKSGFRWSAKTYYKTIKYGHLEGVDIKYPWELSRMQHTPHLAFAYILAMNQHPSFAKPERYLHEFCHQVIDFIATNPPRFGVNWLCPMDVAIRLINWLVTYDIFKSHSADFPTAFEATFQRSIFEHGKHIWNNLEWSPVLRGNHYLSDLAGLIFAAAYLPKQPATQAWLTFAVKEFLVELDLQFHNDGTNFEGSTSYHRLSAEIIYACAALLLQMPEYRFHIQAILPKLYKIAQFTLDISQSGGEIPQIGDNDSGRLLKLGLSLADDDIERVNDHRPLLYLASAFSQNPRLAARNSLEYAYFSTLIAHPPMVQAFHKNTAPHIHYPDFGLVIFNQNNYQLMVRCGSVGQNGFGGHAHNDQLSFILTVNECPFLIDPGTYVYTALPSARNHFRATAMHNTLHVHHEEQNRWLPGKLGLFELDETGQAVIDSVTATSFRGQWQTATATHTREFTLQEETIRVKDSHTSHHLKSLSFHLHPAVKRILTENEDTLLLENQSQQLLIHVPGCKAITYPCDYSPSYGIKQPSLCVSFNLSGSEQSWSMLVLPPLSLSK